MEIGTITHINLERGFGFIKPDSGGENIFFHCRRMGCELIFEEALMEMRVSFDVVQTVKGASAENLRAAT